MGSHMAESDARADQRLSSDELARMSPLIHTRRDFVRGSIGAGLSLSVLGSVLAACGSGSSDETSAAGGGTPQPGGTLDVSVSTATTTDNLDPTHGLSTNELLAAVLLYDTLINFSPDYTEHPALAESWDSSNDLQNWKFNLRKGVEFHSGKTMTSKDVVYTFRRVLDPDTAAGVLANLGPILDPDGVQADGKYGVVFKLKQPFAFFPVLACHSNCRIVAEGTPTNYAGGGAGTGPFALEKFDPGSSLQVKKNPNYWMEGRPYLDAVRLTNIPESSTKLQSVLSGEADLAFDLDYSQGPQADSASGASLVRVPGAQFIAIDAHQNDEPFKDVSVRQALKYSEDRQQYVDTVFNSYAVVGLDLPIAPNDPLYPADLPTYAHDPDKAKSLISDAGFSNGLDITFSTSNAGAGMVESAQLFQQQGEDAGMTVKIDQSPPSTYWSKVWNQVPLYNAPWVRVHPVIMYAQFYLPGPWNETGFDDPEFEKRFTDFVETTDKEEQKQRLASASEVVNDKSSQLIPAQADQLWAAKSEVKNIKQSGFNDNNFLDFREMSL